MRAEARTRRLLAALADLTGPAAQLLSHAERAWASITFSGARHNLTYLFEGTEAVERGEAFIALLPEHEFALPGQLVADATVTAVEHTLCPGPTLRVGCELLLLDDR